MCTRATVCVCKSIFVCRVYACACTAADPDLLERVNALLPRDIVVHAVVRPRFADFHARRDAARRLYE